MILHPYTTESELHTISIQHGCIVVEHCTPQYSESEHQQQLQRIAEDLFAIFRKYQA